MNNKTMLKGCAVLAMGLMMAQCNENKQTSTPVVAPATGTATSGLKIAFVEVDSLLSSYEFCIEMNQAMVKKEENVRATKANNWKANNKSSNTSMKIMLLQKHVLKRNTTA